MGGCAPVGRVDDVGYRPTAGRTHQGMSFGSVYRTSDSWAAFLRSHAEAILTADFFETVTLTGARMYVPATIEHVTRRFRILGATAHPTAAWVDGLSVKTVRMSIRSGVARLE